ncbi:pentatricopeptide repeat-containing protein [Tripterygium wilfordii]|uniref:Pentatricopeptide repeat-containing protein n=1 Tax=Tripterygium wilfordii TaxID=458696 RepID=A0A7J7BWQ9_TRIWF|nr:pentatricopeptide repeat-containing protein At4g31070, mitochondrial [Tripterygium wilfordii]KAF5725976.1 pentatricopeptide repeat-containing protein [Tripterygium wilfordii]
MKLLSWTRVVSLLMHHPVIGRFSSTSHLAQPISIILSQVKDMVLRGLDDQILKFYKQDLHPSGLYDSNTFVLPSVIKACSSQQSHEFGVQLHGVVLKTGSDADPFVSNSLITMYAKSSETDSARKVFDAMPQRDTVSWNSIINCYTQNGCLLRAVEMMKEMYLCGFLPKPELLASILSLCSHTGDLRLGKVIHALVIVNESIENSVLLSTSLVDLYLKCHESFMALHVFNGIEFKNEVSWTAMISGCIANQNYDLAIGCLRAMQVEGFKPNRVTLVSVLPAFGELGCIIQGKEIHGCAVRLGFDTDHHFSTALIDMYCKCRGAMHSGRLIFERSKAKDVVMWSSIIGGYSRSDGLEAMKLFRRMRAEGIEQNYVTLLAIVTACATLSSLKYGRGVHGYILRFGLNYNIFIGNALINMYSKCGCIVSSRRIFNEMPVKDSISWSTLISANGIHGCAGEALQLYYQMQERKIEPDAPAFLAILSACNHSGLVEEGENLFNNAIKDKIPVALEHYACFVDLLGKSGKIEDACDIVRTMPMKSSPRIWTSLISACKIHGRFEMAALLEHQLIKSEPENAANYALLSNIYAESGDWVGVERVREVMREQGLKKCYGFSRIELEN